MGAMIYSCGPAHIFVAGPAGAGAGGVVSPGGGGGGPPSYLGTCERAPEIEVLGAYYDYFADEGGHKLPTDLLRSGAQAYIRLDLTRFDEAAYSKIATPGGMTATSIGELMVRQKKTFEVYIDFTNTGVVSTPPIDGYHFFACVCESEKRLDMGPAASRLGLVIRAIRNASGALFDNDVNSTPLPS